MKNQKAIIGLIIVIIIFSAISSGVGILTNEPGDLTHATTVHGDVIELYGKGIYKLDSVSVAAQGIANDMMVLAMGIPLLAASCYLSAKGSFKGKLLLTGTLAFFLYTYMSYAFLWMYNAMFSVYVILMSASFFAFVLMMMSFDIGTMKTHFSEKLPVKWIGGFQIFVAVSIGMLWIGKIAEGFQKGGVPVGLEHYTSLVIQGMDLAFVVPCAFLSGILLIRRNNWGYLLSSVILLKGITMLTALSAMIISMAMHGVTLGLVEVVMFPAFNVVAVFALIVLLKNIRPLATV